ncbi:MAG TPA: hypothetical protein VLK65_09740 [Vicinamibacteria bacterium]|nr:hypothetical protein [Vicinamibacteria bacterium]
MKTHGLALTLMALGVAVSYVALAPAQVPTSCPVSLPPETPFTPPTPYPTEAPYGTFWWGTEGLWTMLRADGTWRGVPPDRGYRRGYRDKVFWWRPGYDGRVEPRPELEVTGRRIDAEAPPFTVPSATNAHSEDFGGWTMLTGVDIPTTGCWEITGRYADESLTFVVWVVE